MTREDLVAEVGAISPEALKTVLGWLERGDGCAIYENRAFDSANAGHKKYVSFGSPSAQLETDTPPARLPDIREVNWKYVLVESYRTAQGGPANEQPVH